VTVAVSTAPGATDAASHRLRLPPAAWATIVVFAACLVGIATRPAGLLASVWPANAILVGLFVRWPAANSPAGWLGAALAYVSADLVTGSPVDRALLLNAANLAGVAAALTLCVRLPADVIRLRQPAAVLYLALAAVAAGAAGGLVASLGHLRTSPDVMLTTWVFWFATEFANYVAILPMVLVAPAPRALRHALRRGRPRMTPARAAPFAALIASCIAAVLIGGPGSLAFPVPALLWCAITYAMFPTTVLTFLFGSWTLIAVAFGYLPGPAPAHGAAMMSARLGISLIAIAPVMIASAMASRDDVLNRMRVLATHDPLTGLVNRGAFTEGVGLIPGDRSTSVALLMMDIDHFKPINDGCGHAGGDAVLVAFAQRVRACLRAEDLFARVGGDEFAIFATGRSVPDLFSMAERIRSAISDTPFSIGRSREVPVTASIGMAVVSGDADVTLDRLLADADTALYRAKADGRDRIGVVTTSL
jgi:diguanylate cyclase (GGDEF)-like protein